jgi:hypothetical protein
MPQQVLRHARSSTPSWTRRCFLAASGAAALLGRSGHSLEAAELKSLDVDAVEAIDFPESFLYCTPTGSGIWVRVQMECRGCLTDLASGKSNEYVMGVMAKTGLTPVASTGKMAPGYDYWIVFSKTHVFTKRSHSSAYLNNPTVLEHKDFGEASWRLQRVSAEPLRAAADIRNAIEHWRRMTAKTVFTSADGARQFTVEYPVKWADYSLKSEGFRVETGPVFLLDPDKSRVGAVPEFDDFQWAYVDSHAFDRARCLIEQPTSILADATFTPPPEHGRENRETVALTEAQVQEIQDALYSGDHISVPRETVSRLLSTDHFSRASDVSVRNELYALSD